MNQIKLIECPRDAMQGIHQFIDTELKIRYINSLLKVGFDTIDFGSFVSPKAIPQLRDTAEVLAGLDLSETNTKLLAIVANMRGAEDAAKFPAVDYIGFPFSISETFQRRNTNSSIDDAKLTVMRIREICEEHDKEAVIYISMAFGNPYGDEWNRNIVADYTGYLVKAGFKVISLADTVGVAKPDDVFTIFNEVHAEFSNEVELGVHLHCTPDNWKTKVSAAWDAGCRRFDAAVKGYGGCPMAEDELVGNLATENLLSFLEEQNNNTGINYHALNDSLLLADQVFASAQLENNNGV